MTRTEWGMIAADTSRTRAYLQALARHQLLPSHVLILPAPQSQSLPGQQKPSQSDWVLEPEWREAQFDPSLVIESFLSENAVTFERLSTHDINDPSVAARVRERPESVMIFSGYGGALLRAEILGTGKKFLHIHGGYLPRYKGSTTNYFSLLTEGTMGASSLFLNEEIDSGAVLKRKLFQPPADRTRIDHVYDSAARAEVLVETLLDYLAKGDWHFEVPPTSEGETYFIIHPVLKHLAILGSARK